MDAGELSFIVGGFTTRRIVDFGRREQLGQIDQFQPVFGIKVQSVPLACALTFSEKLHAVIGIEPGAAVPIVCPSTI